MADFLELVRPNKVDTEGRGRPSVESDRAQSIVRVEAGQKLLQDVPFAAPRKITISKEPVDCANSICEIASRHEGHQLWKVSKYSDVTENGRLGCAASLSVLLQKAGYKYANCPTVGGLQSQLLHNGWTKHPVSEIQADDVVVAVNSKNAKWQEGGGSAHIGAAAKDGGVWNNSKRNSAKWTKEDIDVAFPSSDYDKRWVLRPPKRKVG